MTASIPAMAANGFPIRRAVRVMTEVAAAHSIVPRMDMIAMHALTMLEIAAALGGSAGIGIRETSTDADADRGVDIEAGSDSDSKVECGEARDAYAKSERRHVDFTECERDPAHGCFGHHHARIESRKRDHRRREERTNHGDRHGRHPSPRSADVYPTAKVEWRITPRGIVNPAPAPGLDPTPMSIAVGSPIGHQAGGKPHGAERRHGPPHAKRV